MTDAKKSAELLDNDVRVPIRPVSHPSSGIRHFRLGTDSDEDLGVYRFHPGDMRRQGVAIAVHLTGERIEAGGTVLRYQAPTYSEVYNMLSF